MQLVELLFGNHCGGEKVKSKGGKPAVSTLLTIKQSILFDFPISGELHVTPFYMLRRPKTPLLR